MLADLIKAFHQLDDRGVQRLLLYCVAGTLAIFAALTVICGVALAAIDPTGIVLVNVLISIAGVGAAVVVAWLLFPVTAVLVLSFFLEDVAEAVERRHYPGLPPVRDIGVAENAWATLQFVAFALMLNLLALPLYLLPGPNIIVYLALNGYLLGREYFELVAQRRATRPEIKRMRTGARRGLFLGGVFIAAMLAVPLFNLVAPVVATAFMVHRFERLRRRGLGVTTPVPVPATVGDSKALREHQNGRI